jgi:hypothetical protein
MNDPKYLDNYSGQNWLITRAALAVNESPPKTSLDQKWLLVPTGVVSGTIELVPGPGQRPERGRSREQQFGLVIPNRHYSSR